MPTWRIYPVVAMVSTMNVPATINPADVTVVPVALASWHRGAGHRGRQSSARMAEW
jgi:hypothetical protein